MAYGSYLGPGLLCISGDAVLEKCSSPTSFIAFILIIILAHKPASKNLTITFTKKVVELP